MESELKYLISRKKNNSEVQYLVEERKWGNNRNEAMIFDSRYKANDARIKSFVECIREGYPANLVKIEVA